VIIDADATGVARAGDGEQLTGLYRGSAAQRHAAPQLINPRGVRRPIDICGCGASSEATGGGLSARVDRCTLSYWGRCTRAASCVSLGDAAEIVEDRFLI
jgi:hypothetical protein